MSDFRHSKSNSDFIIREIKSNNKNTINSFQQSSPYGSNKMKLIQTLAYTIGIIGTSMGIILNYLHYCSFIAMWTIFIVSGMIIFVAQQFYISRTPNLSKQEVKINRDNQSY